MALTQSSRSGDCHVSREVGLPAALPYERRQLPTRVDGPCRARPWEFVGLPPLRVRPVRGPGFIPPLEAPKWLCDFCNHGAAGLGFDDPWPGRPIRLPLFLAFGVCQCWRDGIVPVLMAGRGAGTVESRGRSSRLITVARTPRFPPLGVASHWWVVQRSCPEWRDSC